MKPEFIVSFAAAAIFHALLLFGFRPGTQARPLPLADETVEVNLVEAAPEPPAVEAPPTPTPEPSPEPTPMPQEEPMATPAPQSTPAPPVPLRTPKKIAATPRANTKTTGAANPAAGPALAARPRYRSNPKPEYPAEARRARQQGLVMVSVDVDSNGRALNVSLMRSCGFPALDDAALQAVRRWTFEPARIGGLPVASQVDVPVRFSISE